MRPVPIRHSGCLALIAAGLLLWAPTVRGGTERAARRPAILGHRGALTHAPENTLPAFELCLRTGCDIELDVHPTRDGKLVVIHDATVDRTTDGKGAVASLTLEQVRRLDAGAWFHRDFAGERVPTLDETLALVVARERRPTTVAINLKPVNEAVIDGVIAAVGKHKLLDRAFVFDLSLENARRFKRREPRLRCAASAHTPQAIHEALKLDVVDIIWTGPKPKAVIDEVHAAGKRIYFTLVNDARQWLRARADGVDGICTNYPLEMKAAASPPPADRMWDHYLKPDARPHYHYRPPK